LQALGSVSNDEKDGVKPVPAASSPVSVTGAKASHAEKSDARWSTTITIEENTIARKVRTCSLEELIYFLGNVVMFTAFILQRGNFLGD
jgi:hypothetical protein